VTFPDTHFEKNYNFTCFGRKLQLMLRQEFHLSATDPTAADAVAVYYNQKDATAVNYRWREKRIFSLFLRKVEREKSNFYRFFVVTRP